VTTTADLLLEWDQRRPRSQQRELGMSELGGCRRRAGYRLSNTTPDNKGGSVQAVLGTAIHAAVEQVFHEMQAEGLLPAEDLIEYEVRFANIVGHLDRYDSVGHRVLDTKTTSSRWLQHIKLHGPERSHLWQLNLYAAALIRTGRPVKHIVLDYIARDTGEDWQWTGTPDVGEVRQALQWLDDIRGVELEMLNRDYAPDSAFCRHCPFLETCWKDAVPDRSPLSVLYVEDPNAKKWARQLRESRDVIASAKKLEEEAKGALDALRPNVTGKSDPVDVGYENYLQWTVSTTARLDTDLVKSDYAKAGAQAPTKTTTSTKLGFVPKGAAQEG
jgi:hypothetical protein